jgi:Lrp/AsnC family transcriptional regulator, regulator for asnA, asnC and gidA
MTTIDQLDAKIISLLQADGRRSNVDIARSLAVAEGTVRKRIERLVRDKVIQISAWADPLRIGYQNYAVLMMYVDLRSLDRAAKQLAAIPEVFFLGTCIGEFNLFVSACFRSLEHMHEFMTKRLSKISGIQRLSTSHVTSIAKRDYSFKAVHADGKGVTGQRPVAEDMRVNGSNQRRSPPGSSRRRRQTAGRHGLDG